jgi:hypothetical protein
MGGVNHCRSHCRFGEILWFDVRGQLQPCDWSGKHLFGMCPLRNSRLWVVSSKSQRCIFPRTSNQGNSPDNSVRDIG